MAINYSLAKIKKGKRQVWEDWCRKLMTDHYEEGVFSLTEEDLVRERCFIFGKGDDSYVLYQHQTVVGKKKKPFNPDRKLNQEHFAKLLECLESIDGGVVINGYDFIVIGDYDFQVK